MQELTKKQEFYLEILKEAISKRQRIDVEYAGVHFTREPIAIGNIRFKSAFDGGGGIEMTSSLALLTVPVYEPDNQDFGIKPIVEGIDNSYAIDALIEPIFLIEMIDSVGIWESNQIQTPPEIIEVVLERVENPIATVAIH